MSRRKREAMAGLGVAQKQTDGNAELSATGKKKGWQNLRPGQRWVVIGLLAFLSFGVLGAGLKYLEAYSTRYPRLAGGEAGTTVSTMRHGD